MERVPPSHRGGTFSNKFVSQRTISRMEMNRRDAGSEGPFSAGEIDSGNPADATEDAVQANIVAGGCGEQYR